MVRALQPWPGVVATLDGVDVQIQAGAVAGLDDEAAPGTLAGRVGEAVVVATHAGGYRIDRITPPGKRAMTPAAFLRGRQSNAARR